MQRHSTRFRRNRQDPAIENIRMAQLLIHMKLRLAVGRGAIAPETFQEQMNTYNRFFDDILVDIALERRNYAAFSPILLKMKEKLMTEAADVMNFPEKLTDVYPGYAVKRSIG